MSKKLTVSNVLLLYILTSFIMIFSGIQEIIDIMFNQPKSIISGIFVFIFGVIFLILCIKLYNLNKNHRWYEDINKN